MARQMLFISKSSSFNIALVLTVAAIFCSTWRYAHAAGVLTCACNTNECQTQGRSRCQANNMCYVQHLPPADDGEGDGSGEPDVIQGCINDATPLLCETGPFSAMMMRMPKNSASSTSSRNRGMWPSLTCCSQDMCNTRQKQEPQSKSVVSQQQQPTVPSLRGNVPSSNNNMKPYERHHMLIYSGRKQQPVGGIANIPVSSATNNNRASSSSSSSSILSALLDQHQRQQLNDFNNKQKPIQIDTGDDIDAQPQLDLAAADIIIKTSSSSIITKAAEVPPTTIAPAVSQPSDDVVVPDFEDDRRQQRTYLFGVNPVYIIAPALACVMIMTMAFVALFMIKNNHLCLATGSTSSWPSSSSFHGGYTSGSRARSKLRRLSNTGNTLSGLTLGLSGAAGDSFTLGPYNHHPSSHHGSPTLQQQQQQLLLQQPYYSNAPTGTVRHNGTNSDSAYNVGNSNLYTSTHRTSTYLNNHRQIFDAASKGADSSW